MPRIAETWFDNRFASQRIGLIEAVSQHLSKQQPGLEAVGTWLETDYSEAKVRVILERRRQQYPLRDAGQPTPPDGRRIPRSGYRDLGLPGDGLRADRLEQAFTALHGQNRDGHLLRLLGQNLPQNERKTNAMRAVVVSACIVDPDVDKWLASVTPLASCPWQGDSQAVPPVKGRADVAQPWAHEALRLLQEACSVLGWEPAGSSTPSTTSVGDAGEPVVESVDRTTSGRKHKTDSGNRLKRDAKRDLVMQFLRDKGGWDGTLEDMEEALKKEKGLTVSPSTLSRYLKGTKYQRRGRPHRSSKIPGKRSAEREAVADGQGPDALSTNDTWTMPED